MNSSRKDSSRFTPITDRISGGEVSKPSTRAKRGFTLTELIVGTIIGLVVVAVAGIGLQAAVRFIGESRAYSVASRSANNSFEFMPWKDIEKASAVEILPPDHDIDTGLNEGWIYISLDNNPTEPERGSYVTVIRSEDGRVIEPVPGSEHINSLSFTGGVFRSDMTEAKSNDPINKNLNGARVLLMHIGATGNVDKAKSRIVSRDRSLPIRKASAGVTLENGVELEKSDSGQRPLLRYKMGGEEVEDPTLEIYGADGSNVFTNPTTWDSIDPFDMYTLIDAKLELPPSVRKSLDPAYSPVFTLIACEQTTFLSSLPRYGIDPQVGRVQPRDNEALKDWNDNLLQLLLAEDRIPKGTARGQMQHTEKFEEVIGNLNLGTSKFNILRVILSDETSSGSGIYEFREKFQFGIGLAKVFPAYNGAYLVVLAHYKKQGSTEWDMVPAYAQLGRYEADRLFIRMQEQIEDSVGKTALVLHDDANGTWYNNSDALGEMDSERNTNGGRGSFTVRGPKGAGGVSPKIMLELRADDFKHMRPTRSGLPDLYGPTNYALYVDAQMNVTDKETGYGVFLNGSTVQLTTIGGQQYNTAGYVFQYDPHAEGFPIRFFGYNGGAYGESAGGGEGSWGVRPMYFYDAAKPTLPAPKSITTSAAASPENFNGNAGAADGQNINYRLPFYTTTNNYWGAPLTTFYGTNYATNYATNSATINNRARMWRQNAYGMSPSTYSVYFPKLMQSWHKPQNTQPTAITEAILNGTALKGYRWNGAWSVVANTDRWKERHILKLTILEVTRDIMKTEVIPEWRDQIHHTEGIGGTGGKASGNYAKDIIHERGDMFVRAELIQLKNGVSTTDDDAYLDSMNYVYSKPIWYGKFKGDAWSGSEPSPFKKMGNTMVNTVAPEEQKNGDQQSYRRRGMHVRSWKDEYAGWDFTKDPDATDWFPKKVKSDDEFPPDLLYPNKDVWTPPIAINLNAGDNTQNGGNNANSFGQYQFNTNAITNGQQNIGRVNNIYNGNYTDRIYGRLSLLRNQGDANPLYGLYAMRGWDFGTSRSPTTGNNAVITYDDNNTAKRFLSVVQGLRLPHLPSTVDSSTNLNRPMTGPDPDPDLYPYPNPANPTTKGVRDRIIAYRFWGDPSRMYDTWIGEGFSPKEVRDILGIAATGDYSDSKLDATPQPITDFYGVAGYYGDTSIVPR